MGWMATIKNGLGWEGNGSPNIGSPALVPQSNPFPRHAARQQADVVAGLYLIWLRQRYPAGIFTSQGLADIALWEFSDMAGVAIPRERSLLGALKRIGGMHHRQDVRLYSHDGRYVRKATVYGFTALPGRMCIDNLTCGD